jgi:hypothetical protein
MDQSGKMMQTWQLQH